MHGRRLRRKKQKTEEPEITRKRENLQKHLTARTKIQDMELLVGEALDEARRYRSFEIRGRSYTESIICDVNELEKTKNGVYPNR